MAILSRINEVFSDWMIDSQSYATLSGKKS